MPKSAQFYIYGVIAVGTALLAGSLASWAPQRLADWLLYLALAMLASSLKLRLPGLTRTYSFSFLFLLFGVGRFSLPEVLIAGCAGALVQSVCNAKTRPTLLQVLFNMANLTISIGLCFLLGRVVLSSGFDQYRPAAMALIAFLYFLVNTVLVSGRPGIAGRQTPQGGFQRLVCLVVPLLPDWCRASRSGSFLQPNHPQRGMAGSAHSGARRAGPG